jgi:hypothetical protein
MTEQVETPEKIRFIKLGNKGKWEYSCIEAGNLRIGYESPFHSESRVGDWGSVKKFWLDVRKNNSQVATSDLRQIRDFYELTDKDIWITFHQRRLYWCQAKSEVIELDDKTRVRETVNGWSCFDIDGKPLLIENLDGRLTKAQGYRGTICSIEDEAYLMRKINGLVNPDVDNTLDLVVSLQQSIKNLIQGLWWHDFELLTDLIISKSGWQRLSVLGKTEKDIDIEIYSSLLQKKGCIQIKSKTNSKEIEGCVRKLTEYSQYDYVYFVYHTCEDEVSRDRFEGDRVHLWDIDVISRLVIDLGLINWLLNKSS